MPDIKGQTKNDCIMIYLKVKNTDSETSASRRRSLPYLVQVSISFGAGRFSVGVSAPLDCVERRFPAQVPYEKTDLRQTTGGLAPIKGGTCATALVFRTRW